MKIAFLLTIVIISGCAQGSKIHPIYGEWILDVKATDPEAPAAIKGRMVFGRNGTRESSFRWGVESPVTDEIDLFRVDGDHVYITDDGKEHELVYAIDGDILTLRDHNVPGALVFRRKR